MHKPLALIILDGFGHSGNLTGNAVAMAHKPTLDFLEKNYPYTFLQASGSMVGLDWGEPGNSEVGHLAIGAGRIVKHYLRIINESITNQTFFSNKTLLLAVQHAKSSNSKLHILGLLTSGSVHASFKHLTALLDFVKKTNLPEIYLHLFTDGKDSGTRESISLLLKLKEQIKDSPSTKIATIIGRDMAMDRNNNWGKTKKAYDLLVDGIGSKASEPIESLKQYHQQGLTDNEIPATVLDGLNSPLITENDALIFFNFREDSMKQLVRSLTEESFSLFATKPPANLFVAVFTKYLESVKINPVFEPILVKNNLAEWLSLNQKKQLHIAESEKYAHVTLFFNGLENKVYEGETDLFLESSNNLAERPEMKSAEISQRVIEKLKRGSYDFFLVNFANSDTLSHTGNIHLVAKGIEKVDEALGKIYTEIRKMNGSLVVTSDHGNAESLVYGLTGEKETKHNLNPVPFYLVANEFQGRSLPREVSGILPDIAPTILELMGLPIPQEMTGQSLLNLVSTRL